mgnify:CR=1 FL=1
MTPICPTLLKKTLEKCDTLGSWTVEIYLNSNSFFSKNLLKFEDLTRTKYYHFTGAVVTFKERLTAIGGQTRKVEVYDGGSWNDQTIPPIGNKDRLNENFFDFTSLAFQSQLYVFGNIPVFNQD